MQLRMPRSIAIRADQWQPAEQDAASLMMDHAAFRELYEHAAPRLRGYLRRAAGPGSDSALADDLLQESFLKLLNTALPAPVLADERQLRAYLYRIATNLLNDHWRRAQRERRWSLLTFSRGERAAAQPEGTEYLSMDMARAFAQIKPQEQSLLWLAYVEGFDHSEIATALSVGERSVRVLLHRARRRLAQLLKERACVA
jgi:RNA polymerase sigma-70 factor (ECF subfamily)